MLRLQKSLKERTTKHLEPFMGVRSYRELTVWQLGIDLVHEVYQATRRFPKSEVYGLTSQIQRAAVSIPSNIAEGQQRDSTKDFLRHLSIALGSLAELNTLLAICDRLSYLQSESLNSMGHKAETIGKMLRALQKSLKRKIQFTNHQPPTTNHQPPTTSH
ncbi:MAG: four helix bundle protein [Candidatus Saccharimonadales bacterium]